MSCTFSVIITCYNHVAFLPSMKKMLEEQIFQDFEVIIIDNNSEDGSVQWISENKNSFSHVVINNKNEGLCKAFNKGVSLSKGKYLIDLSPDDVFMANKLQRNYDLLSEGHLLFSDCEVSTVGGSKYIHSEKYQFNYKGLGNYFIDILSNHCLASPTMVVSRICFDAVGQYNESLAYEDFDFMTKASKLYDIVYDSAVLVIKQEGRNNLSSQFKKRNSEMHLSTFRICERLQNFCETKAEKKALNQRVYSEMKAQIKLLNFGLVWNYLLVLFA